MHNSKDTIPDNELSNNAPIDQSKRAVLAKLGKYAAYTTPVMLITLGASGRKAEAQSAPSPA